MRSAEATPAASIAWRMKLLTGGAPSAPWWARSVRGSEVFEDMDLGCTVRDGTGTIEREKAAWVLVERELPLALGMAPRAVMVSNTSSAYLILYI